MNNCLMYAFIAQVCLTFFQTFIHLAILNMFHNVKLYIFVQLPIWPINPLAVQLFIQLLLPISTVFSSTSFICAKHLFIMF